MMVSVIMITFNHEKFIEKAILSVLNQQTTFDFELIVANDCSTDQTDVVINTIIATHPNGAKIKYLLQQNNLGANKNFISAYNLSTATYIALCEGDDYWTDNNKLQKQVTFLNSNLQYSGVTHHVAVLNEIHQNTTLIKNDLMEIDRIAILKQNSISTLSLVFRNNIQIPKWLSDVKIGDFVLHMLNLKNGLKYFNLNETMGVYRVHSAGNYENQTQTTKYKHQLSMLQYLINDASFEFNFIEKSWINYQVCQIHLHNKSGTFNNQILHDIKYKFLGKYYTFIIKMGAVLR